MDPTLQAVLAAVVSFIIITFIFSVIYCICHTGRKHRRVPEFPRQTRAIRNPPTSASFISIADSQLFDPSLTQIEMSDLVKATSNFSPDLIVGDGSFGLVYKANLPSGVTVAVKKLDADAFQGYREFRAEMETLGEIRHDNIVKFFGYCATGTDRILIYEFIENGSLDQWLYVMSSMDNQTSALRLPLSWTTRVNIIKGVAKALAFLHNLDTPIIHRDIKASNILLDADFEAHIADFGLARRLERLHSHVSTQVAGTMGYMPPEVFHGATVATVMGDVYSFGILMFEIVTSRRPNLPMKEDYRNKESVTTRRPNLPSKEEDGKKAIRNKESVTSNLLTKEEDRNKESEKKEIRFIEWATRMVSQNREMEMVDDRMSREGIKENEVLELLKIATFCTTEMPKLRPSMNEVVELLNQI